MKFYKTLIIIIFIAGVHFSCEDFLTEVPQSQIDAYTFYSNAEAAEIGITGAYNRFFNEGGYSRLVMLAQVSTDDVNQPSGAFSMFQDRTLMAAPNGDNSTWSQMYETIANVNFLLQEVEKLDSELFPNPNRKEEILGEAHFLKGAVYYYLYNLWGAVPIVEEFSEDPQDLIIPKSSKEEVRTYAIGQLQLADEMLPDVIESYPNDPETNLRKGRASKWAAKAYLARFALEEEDYQQALTLANQIIESGLYPLATVWRTMFQEPYNGSESIFEQQNDYSPGFFGSGTYGWFMGFDFEWSESATLMFERPDVMGETQGKDVRFNLAYTPYPWGPNRWQPNKVIPPRLFANGGIEQANFPIIRTSELYLIKAEVLVEMDYEGNKEEVVDILNMMRERAEDPTWDNGFFPNEPLGTTGISLYDIEDFNSKEELLDAVKDEKRRELIFEDIIRWTDLMRWDQDYLMEVTNSETADHLYWPIPVDEIARNNELDQNPAYD